MKWPLVTRYKHERIVREAQDQNLYRQAYMECRGWIVDATYRFMTESNVNVRALFHDGAQRFRNIVGVNYDVISEKEGTVRELGPLFKDGKATGVMNPESRS